MNGYTVEGSSVTLTGETPTSIEVGDGTANGANFSATIASVIDGTGTLTKTGLGTLILTADNTYTGGTIISEGTLQIGNGRTDREASVARSLMMPHWFSITAITSLTPIRFPAPAASRKMARAR